MSPDDTLANALLGAVVTVVVSPFVPFAPIFGGLLAGYLQGGDREDGLWIGTVSGAIALSALGGWLGNYVRYDTDIGAGE